MPGKHSYTAQSGTGVCTVDTIFRLDELEQQFVAQVKRQARAILDQWAREVRAWMQANHPWQNRTGEAERTLGVLGEFTEEVWRIVLTGGVHYQKYLELYFLGRFKILAPALDVWGQVLLDRLGAERI